MKQLKGQKRLFGDHGGPRENAGRRPDHPSGKKKPVTLSLSPNAHRQLWQIARKNHDGNRSAAVEDMLDELTKLHEGIWQTLSDEN